MKLKINVEKLEELVRKGLKDHEIATIMKCSPIGVYSSRKRNNIQRNNYTIAKGIKPSSEQINLIVGTLLGDSNMRIDKACINPRFTCEHGISQLEYCKWKFKKLESLNAKFKDSIIRKTPDKRTGKLYKSCKVFIGNNPEFTFIYNMFYKNNKKVISKEIYSYFNELSLAVMFMDDGYKHSHSIGISTDCFTVDELNDFIDFIFNKYKIRFTIHGRNKLYLPARFLTKFKEIVLPFIHPTMMYKFPK